MILFTADWHIKLGQKNVPREWAIDRYQKFFDQVHELEKQCNMHVIGGDVFDRLPNMEELELYFEFVSKVQIPTLIYDGNHEATKKNKTFFSQLKKVTKDINPLVKVVDMSYYDNDFGFEYCRMQIFIVKMLLNCLIQRSLCSLMFAERFLHTSSQRWT